MILTLLAVSLNDQPLPEPITAHFDSRGGTLGRADHNTMALPDPQRHVSRVQAEIIAGSHGFVIRNVGTANPIGVAGRSVSPGESTVLAAGDEVRVGGYLLQVQARDAGPVAELSFAAPAAGLAMPAPPQLPAMAQAAVAAADAQHVWALFCRGAGVDVPPPAAGDEQRWHDLGRAMRGAVDGMLRLMAVRASTRHELRAAVTVIQARDNNPLKFSPDGKTGLEYLLQPTTAGFLDGPAAVEDAMQDLVGHAMGTVAGIRAAIDGMLERFEPQALEAKLGSKSLFDGVLPNQRKAKLWELYVRHHGTLREEAQEDFHTLFGKAFLAAYEQQIEELKRAAPRA